jgi:hypothetical protein
MESMLMNPAVMIPLGAFAVAIVAIVSGAFSQAHSRRLKAEQRMALLARGVPPLEIEAILGSVREDEEQRSVATYAEKLANTRTTALILMSSGIGIASFFFLLAFILGAKPILCGAAAGAIPFAIGVGFQTDYNLRKQERAQGDGAETGKMLG